MNKLGQTNVPGFLTKENIAHVSKLITESIAKKFSNPDSTIKRVIVPPQHIYSIMKSIQYDYPESIAKMNERVVMYITSDFIQQVIQQEKNNFFAANYRSTIMYQNAGIQNFQIGSALKGQKVGKNTSPPGFRFAFTY